MPASSAPPPVPAIPPPSIASALSLLPGIQGCGGGTGASPPASWFREGGGEGDDAVQVCVMKFRGVQCTV
jgi:hypothetical protein